MSDHYVFEIINIEQIQTDPDQPRKRGNDSDLPRLVASIKKYGIEMPLSVVRTDDGVKIIDGHRRYTASRQLGLTELPCRVYEKMSKGELESRRFEIQTNRRPWRPLERAGILNQIKNFFRFNNNQLSEHVHISESLAANCLQLLGEKLEYLEMMKEHGLDESYQMEFIRLKPKLRRIKEFEIDEIIEKIFQKTKQKTIKNSKDYRRLGSIFKRATANEAALHQFFLNPDETIGELIKNTSHSGISLYSEDLIKAIAEKMQKGETVDAQERIILQQVITIAQQILSV